jgi:hypothetical protein
LPIFVDNDGTLHEQYRLLVFVDGAFLGESNIDPGSCPDLGYRRSGRAWFCPDCGDVWGRVVLIDSHGEQMPLEVDTVSCARHKDQWETPGSLLSGYRNEGYLRHLPEPALRRELEVNLKQMEREDGIFVSG